MTDWLPLHQHLDDTFGVADALVDSWLPVPVLRRIAADFGGDVELARIFLCWLSMSHDVGKSSPAFGVQVKCLADRMREFGLDAPPWLEKHELRGRVNHALVGHLAVQEWLEETDFDFDTVAEQWASVVGSHHGVTPEWSRLVEAAEQVDLSGAGVWAEARRSILAWTTARIGGRDVLARMRGFRLSTPTLALATAVVIVADWIASNQDLFPLRPISTLRDPDQLDADRSLRRLEHGWSELGLPPRWTAPRPGDVQETFSTRFGRAPESIRAVQVAAVEAARELGTTGLLVIEAPMGAGKTEAALLAAEVLAYSSGASGCFVALPTQATTDAMFSRVRAWLDRLPGSATVSLAHGKAHLNDEFTGLARRSRFSYTGSDDAVTVHQWMRGRKKTGLADFVVGTIDQVLFAGLKSRHLMLRHLALAGKVVVIDEVHAYDVYMSQYLHRVLHWLGAYEVPVVMLSATLPDARRQELIAAYESGRGVEHQGEIGHPGYPVISGSHGLATRVLPLPERSTAVKLDRLDDSLETLIAYLRVQLASGGCAVVVRNTVGRVQETAEAVARAFGDEHVTIAHARFLACDRAAIDRDLVRRFGPPEMSPDRPRMHIVVASQVVEQSLDIDFDVMVTDLAPTDLLLQRMGRLHRHERAARTREARCAITGADWTTAPPLIDCRIRKVYSAHQLLRAAALFDREEITLPRDIATLVQAAYGQASLGPEAWRETMDKAEQAAVAEARDRAAAARTYLLAEVGDTSLIDWLHADAGDVDEGPKGSATGSAQVRDSAQSLEVLVVQRDSDGGLRTPDWIKDGGQQIPLMGELPWPLVRSISACSLRLPPALSHNGIIDAVIAHLEKQVSPHNTPSFHATPTLRGQLVLALDDDHTAVVCGFRLTYDVRRGLLHERL